MNIRNIPLESITDENRARVDYGDVDSLKNDINKHGLIYPLTVSRERGKYKVLAGGRRFRAIQKLKWEKAPCIVMNKDVDRNNGRTTRELSS